MVSRAKLGVRMGDGAVARQTILVVEDDGDLRESLCEIIEAEGYEVYGAENGAAALDMLPKIPKPSLIVLDLMMPVMNGWQLLSALRHSEIAAAIPVMVVSAVGDFKTTAGVRFVPKPIDLTKLMDIIRGVRSEAHSPGPVASADAKSVRR